LQAETFCNSIMDRLISECRQFICKANVFVAVNERILDVVFTQTPKNSQLRHVLLDNYVMNAEIDGGPKNLELLGIREFYYQLANHYLASMDDEDDIVQVWRKDPCTYHTHWGKPEGYSCTSKVK
jgi:hypothetical protein